MIQPVPADFKCRRCGNCCTINGSVAVKESEIERMANHLGVSVHEFTAQFTELNNTRMGLRLKDHKDGSCIMLAEDRSCRINPVKPRQCSGFPHDWNYKEWTKVCSFNYPDPDTKRATDET